MNSKPRRLHLAAVLGAFSLGALTNLAYATIIGNSWCIEGTCYDATAYCGTDFSQCTYCSGSSVSLYCAFKPQWGCAATGDPVNCGYQMTGTCYNRICGGGNSTFLPCGVSKCDTNYPPE